MMNSSVVLPTHMDDTKSDETSSSSDSLLPLKKRMRTLDDSSEDDLVAVPTKKVAFPGKAKYKGVVQQQNGHWGAQIYADQRGFGSALSNPMLKPPPLTIAPPSSYEDLTLTRTGTSLCLRTQSTNLTFKNDSRQKLC
ncbi:unnamed protein product [Microthlaspi erraticum]|uniref:Uncharacterized protein n=1 Tax=Microthlaspi erraticum TaxID=1685480 RepID=A0A6D2K2M8_9BRAS|nr:unnamed protein product [Microthlaspi erraticum]